LRTDVGFNQYGITEHTFAGAAAINIIGPNGKAQAAIVFVDEVAAARHASNGGTCTVPLVLKYTGALGIGHAIAKR
jgi:hypothetical protein